MKMRTRSQLSPIHPLLYAINLLLLLPNHLFAAPCVPRSFVRLSPLSRKLSTSVPTTTPTSAYNIDSLGLSAQQQFLKPYAPSDPIFEDILEIEGDDENAQEMLGRKPRRILHQEQQQLIPTSDPYSDEDFREVSSEPNDTQNSPTEGYEDDDQRDGHGEVSTEMTADALKAASGEEESQEMDSRSKDHLSVGLITVPSGSSTGKPSPSIWKASLLLLIILFLL